MSRRLIGGGALLLAFSVGSLVFYSRDRLRSPSASGAGGPDAVLAATSKLGCGVSSAGTQRRYSLDMASTVTASNEKLLSFKLSGTWEVTHLSLAGSKSLVRVALKAPKFGTETKADPADAENVRSGFAQPLYLSLDGRGQIVETRKPAEMPSLVEQVLSYVAGASQFVCPETPAAHWETEESDPLGRFRAAYQRTSSQEVSKSKRDYLQSHAFASAGSAPQTSIQILEFTAKFGFDTGGALAKLAHAEKTLVTSDGPMPKLGAESTVRLELQTQERVAVAPAELERAHALAAFRSGQRLTSGAAEAFDSKHARTAGLSFAEGLLRWRATGENQKSERARLFVALATILSTDEAAVTDAAARIRRKDAERGLLIDALGKADSPGTQAALTGLARDGALTDEDRKRALIGLSMTRAPTEATVTWLSAHTQDALLGRQSRFGLGAAAYQAGSSRPQLQQQAVKHLVSLLSETDVSSLIDTLTALGAAGSRSALPQIEPLTHHLNTSVRAAAVNALRRIPGDDIDQMLARAATSDPERAVKEAAIEAAKERSFSATLSQGLTLAATGDQSVSVRYHAIEALIRWARSVKTVAPTLAWVATNDDNERVRQLAGQALEALKEPS